MSPTWPQRVRRWRRRRLLEALAGAEFARSHDGTSYTLRDHVNAVLRMLDRAR